MEHGMSDWKPEDEVVTNFKTIKQAQDEAYQEGWGDAIEYVLDISKQMRYNNPYITPTLEELEQRIV
jgi:protoheme ferro-lyase